MHLSCLRRKEAELKSHPLFQDILTGHGTGLQCEICFKSFRDKYKLKRHSVVHTKENPYACELCSTRFTRPESLKRHLKNMHQGNQQQYSTLSPFSSGGSGIRTYERKKKD